MELFSRGQVAESKGRDDLAIAHYRALLAKDPRHVPALRLLGACLERTGDRRSAILELEKLARLEPSKENVEWLERLRKEQPK